MTDQPLRQRHSAPAVTSARSLRGAAPLTTKFAVGNPMNVAVRLGLLCQSCAQAARPNTSTLLRAACAKIWSKRLASSERTKVAVCDAYVSANGSGAPSDPLSL